jgi:hypothetical protein
MQPTYWSTKLAFLVLGIFLAVELTATTMAEPLAPFKVRTITIRPQSDDDNGEQSASPVSSFKVSTVRVQPLLSGERRDGSGGKLHDEKNFSDASNVDVHKIRTFQVSPGPDAMSDAYRYLIPTTAAPAQSLSE